MRSSSQVLLGPVPKLAMFIFKPGSAVGLLVATYSQKAEEEEERRKEENMGKRLLVEANPCSTGRDGVALLGKKSALQHDSAQGLCPFPSN